MVWMRSHLLQVSERILLSFGEKIVSYLGYLGIKLDKKTNDVRGVEEIISTPDSKVTVCVIPTNEELAICRETVALVK